MGDTEKSDLASGRAVVNGASEAVSAVPASIPDAIRPTRGFDWARLLPAYWMQNYPTDRYWDALLNTLLDGGDVRAISEHTAKIGGVTVWVSNYPYAYGRLYHGLGPAGGLPLVGTRKRLRRAIASAAMSHALSLARGEAK